MSSEWRCDFCHGVTESHKITRVGILIIPKYRDPRQGVLPQEAIGGEKEACPECLKLLEMKVKDE